ncbi:U-box domain-containing protein 7-like [Impatiens glandulifera]|uniref:U-box domain-containing protein 7-like n=1 Tax=Impatiens glandulifera TaxID=253017 RepID=UPI001FB17CB9|nr:U-box domain-containing protein 7-like [Impatiens glandulifera]
MGILRYMCCNKDDSLVSIAETNGCIELVGKTITLFPRIEASRPGCSPGRQALCSLRTAIDNAKSLLQYCAESSKLYLALTGDSILQRCKKSRNALEQCLFQIQNLVPVVLAAEISGIISDLSRITFIFDSSEEEAGKIIRTFLQQSTSNGDSIEIEKSAIETIRLVSISLRITSQKDMETERRSIKMLLDKVSAREQGKKQILVYLLNLLRNYGQLIITENDHGSLRSEELFPSLNDLYLPADSSSKIKSRRTQSCPNNHEMDGKLLLLVNLDELPWDFQCQVVGDLAMKQDFRSSENYVYQLLRFMKRAKELSDLGALRNGAQLFLSLLRTCRSSSFNFHEDAYDLLGSLLSSDVIGEGLSITEVLSRHECHISKIVSPGAVTSIVGLILNILDGTETTSQFQGQAIRILYNLSLHGDACSRIIPSEVVPKLVPFFEDARLARYCMGILRYMCNKDDSLVSIAETNGCIGFVAEALQFQDEEVQENASWILLTLCSSRFEYIQLVMNEGVIPGLVSISNYGNEKGMAIATELLRLLRDSENSGCSVNETKVEVKYNPLKESGNNYNNNNNNIKENNKTSPSSSAILGIRISMFSKRKKKKK